MKIVIIEDEINAYEYLRASILKIRPQTIISEQIDSVKDALDMISNNQEFDLAFMDIQLADGMSFEIFHHTTITQPVIFTTAYDQYAIQAFKVNSIDYLLKPVLLPDLENAILKYENLYHPNQFDLNNKLIQQLSTVKKSRCLVKKGGHFEYVDVADIMYVYSEDSITFLCTKDGKRHIYGKTVESLMQELNNQQFFQINRSQIINAESIEEIHPYLNQRLILKIKNAKDRSFIVSRQRAILLKEWLDN